MKDYNDNWTDMSNWLIHFTNGKDNIDPYLQIMGILSSGIINPGSFGLFRDKAPIGSQPKVCCLSEIPPSNWNRLALHRKSVYGIGFKKDFILNQGGNPIWYIWKGSESYQLIKKLFDESILKPDSPFWPLTSMIEFIKSSNHWEWEREWRVSGGLRFNPSDVAFLFIPESHHITASDFFIEAEEQNTGPAYHCPFIDSTWTRQQTEASINKQNKVNTDFDFDTWFQQYY